MSGRGLGHIEKTMLLEGLGGLRSRSFRVAFVTLDVERVSKCYVSCVPMAHRWRDENANKRTTATRSEVNKIRHIQKYDFPGQSDDASMRGGTFCWDTRRRKKHVGQMAPTHLHHRLCRGPVGPENRLKTSMCLVPLVGAATRGRHLIHLTGRFQIRREASKAAKCSFVKASASSFCCLGTH